MREISRDGSVPVLPSVAISLLVLGTAVAGQWAARYALDDSLMFSRYADHLLAGEGLAWNRGDGSVYGPTSLAFVAVVAFFRGWVPSPAAAVQLSSLVCGIGFVAASILTARREGDDRAVAAIWVPAGLAVWAESLSAHFTTGMDTTLAMLYLAAYLLAVRRVEETPTALGNAGASVLGGCVLAVRPDLGLFPVLVPLSLALSEHGAARKRWISICVGSLALMGAGCLIAAQVLGTPLPLSFYAKSVYGYGAAFEAEYGHVALAEFVDFASGYWLLLVPIAIHAVLDGSWWATRDAALCRGAAVATVLFLGYHLFGTLPIMPYKERFFHPALPAIVFLSAWALRRIPFDRWIPTGAGRASLVPILLTCGLLSPAAVGSAKALRKNVASGQMGNFDLTTMYRTTSKSDLWFGLDAFSALPDDLVLATTELGLPAAMNPNKRVIDLAGLNERVFALNGFSADVLLNTYAPDLIYLPHPHYATMRSGLLGDPRFRERYLSVPGDALGATLGVAIRRSSPHFEAMKAALDARGIDG